MAKVKVFQKKVKLQGQGHKVKTYGTMRKGLSQGILNGNMKSLSLMVWKLWPRLKFFQKKAKLQGQNLWYMFQLKGLITRNIQWKYEIPIFDCLKVMAKIKVLYMW